MWGDARFNELSPPFLSIGTLHPVLIELTQFLVGFGHKFGEVLREVVEDLIVKPDTGVRG